MKTILKIAHYELKELFKKNTPRKKQHKLSLLAKISSDDVVSFLESIRKDVADGTLLGDMNALHWLAQNKSGNSFCLGYDWLKNNNLLDKLNIPYEKEKYSLKIKKGNNFVDGLIKHDNLQSLLKIMVEDKLEYNAVGFVDKPNLFTYALLCRSEKIVKFLLEKDYTEKENLLLESINDCKKIIQIDNNISLLKKYTESEAQIISRSSYTILDFADKIVENIKYKNIDKQVLDSLNWFALVVFFEEPSRFGAAVELAQKLNLEKFNAVYTTYQEKFESYLQNNRVPEEKKEALKVKINQSLINEDLPKVSHNKKIKV